MTKTQMTKQRGVALISVLLIFAIAAVIAGEVMSRNYRDLRKTANLINSKQAYHFALSGEQYARQILYRDFIEQQQNGLEVDRLSDIWALNFPPFNIDDGAMTIEIRDLQSLYNLNNLVTARGAINGVSVAEFRELQALLSLDNDYTDRLIDWMDTNKTLRTNGAEDADYEQDYLPANRPLADKTELRLLQNMTIEDYLKLAPYVVALPKQLGTAQFDNTKYNINTVDGKLLEAVSPLSASDVKQVEQRQQQGGYTLLQAWLNSSEGANLSPVKSQFLVRSEFFEILVKANYEGRIGVLTTYLHRDPQDGSITVIKRQIGAG